MAYKDSLKKKVDGHSWRAAHQDRLPGYAVEFYNKRAAAIAALKAAPCKDCGQSFPPYVMQFDHVPGRGEKKACVSQLRNGSMQRLLDEIEKCDLVCANCHAERTHRREQ